PGAPSALPPPPATGQRPRPPGAPPTWAARPAPPPYRRPGWRAAATGAARAGASGGEPEAAAVGPSAWPGASRLLVPLPARPPRCARPAAAVDLQPGPAGPVASRLAIYSPTPLGRENGG